GKFIPTTDANPQSIKQKPSRFDEVRSDLEAKKAANKVDSPPEVTRVAADQRQALETDLRRRLQQTSGIPAPEAFQPRMQKNAEEIQKLRSKVEALPKTSTFEPLRQRFDNVEAMFKRTDSLVKGIDSTYSPAEMMKVQVQMYQFTENLE